MHGLIARVPHQECKLWPVACNMSAKERRGKGGDAPLMEKVAIGVNDIRFAEFTLY
jgi:hypothetical protein